MTIEELREYEQQAKDQNRALVMCYENGREMLIECIGPNFVWVTERGFDVRLSASEFEEATRNGVKVRKATLDRAGVVKATEEALAAQQSVKEAHQIERLHTGGYIEASQTE